MNKTSLIKYILVTQVLLFAGSWLASCDAQSTPYETAEPTPSPILTTITSQDISPTASEFFPTETSYLPAFPAFDKPQLIASGNDLSELWWSTDSQIIYWFWGAYDLATMTVTDLNWEIIYQQTPQPDIPEQLPPYYQAFPSPSGSKVVYIAAADTPATPEWDPAIEGGEISTVRQEATLWLWQSGQNEAIGPITQYGTAKYYWTPDEQQLILIDERDMPPDTSAWLIDISARSITLISDELILAKIGPLSPDGSYLLIGKHHDVTGITDLSILNVNTGVKISIKTPISDFAGWLTSEHILVWHYGGDIQANHTLGLLNIETEEFVPLLQGFEELVIGYAMPSPDSQMIAFSAGKDINSQNEVWLMKLAGMSE